MMKRKLKWIQVGGETNYYFFDFVCKHIMGYIRLFLKPSKHDRL